MISSRPTAVHVVEAGVEVAVEVGEDGVEVVVEEEDVLRPEVDLEVGAVLPQLDLFRTEEAAAEAEFVELLEPQGEEQGEVGAGVKQVEEEEL